MILLDTNILLRHARPTDPAFVSVDTTIKALNSAGEELCIVPQNLYEFWVVATRPASSNGLDLSVAECEADMARIKRMFRLLPDRPALLAVWEALVAMHACRGRVSHDARLVAAMRTYEINHILTLNGSDFARFSDVIVLEPATIVRLIGPPSTDLSNRA